MKKPDILDTSAFLACINNEPGGDEIAPFLEGAVLPAPMWTESVSKLSQQGMAAGSIDNIHRKLGLRILTIDRDMAFYAGILHAGARRFGLSHTDCQCIAMARKLEGILYTADRVWAEAAPKEVSIRLIR